MPQKTRRSKNITGQRRSGLLLHLSSLPGPYACGDLGKGAHDFLAMLQRAGQSWWQTLPINPIGSGHSPYSNISSFAGEVLFIGQEGLYESGLMAKKDFLTGINSRARTHYLIARDQKLKMLKKAFHRKQTHGKYKYQAELNRFLKRERHWLEDYALFKVISGLYGVNWAEWPKSLRERETQALQQVKLKYRDTIDFTVFCQFEFFRQWQTLREAARRKRIYLMGDIPIFVSHGSADVWANQDQFLLLKSGKPSYVAGCPPDKFCPDGQLWGNALYDWSAMEDSGFAWWLARFSKLFEMYDAVRLDHFIGFYNFWKIPAAAKNAKNGRWQRARGEQLFQLVERKFGGLPLLAEDLGKVKPGVWELRDKFGFPGMKILQFGFADGENMSVHKLHQIPENSITYTGTHDNDTAVGWYQTVMNEKPQKHEREAVVAMFSSPKRVGEELIRLGMFSKSKTFIFPVQDVLNLDSRYRMNIPGTPSGNWEFRLTEKLMQRFVERCDFLRALSLSSERNL